MKYVRIRLHKYTHLIILRSHVVIFACKLSVNFRNIPDFVSMKVLRMEYNKLYFSEYKKLFCKMTTICFIGLT